MNPQDLDDYVMQIVEQSFFDGRSVQYAVGPLSDRRVGREFRQRGLVAQKSDLCGSIKRLEGLGAFERTPTGERIYGGGSCSVKSYPVVELKPL